MKLISLFILCLAAIVLSQVGEQNATQCEISVVGAGFNGIYATWRLVNNKESTVDPKNICLFEALERVGGRIFTVGGSVVPELGDKVIEGGFYRYHTAKNFLFKTLVEDVFKLPVECYYKPGRTMDQDSFDAAMVGEKKLKGKEGMLEDTETGKKVKQKETGERKEESFGEYPETGKKLKGKETIEDTTETGKKMKQKETGERREGSFGEEEIESVTDSLRKIKQKEGDKISKKDDSKCKTKHTYLMLRNVFLLREQVDDSDDIPYLFSKREEWKNTQWKKHLKKIFMSLITEATNGALSEKVLKDLKKTEMTELAPRLRTIFTRLLNATYKGVPLHQISVRHVIEDKFMFSDEFFHAVRDLSGTIDTNALYSSNMLTFICNYIHYTTFSKKGEWRTIKQREGLNGFTTLINLMLKDIKNKGVKIFMNHELVNIQSGRTEESVKAPKENVIPEFREETLKPVPKEESLRTREKEDIGMSLKEKSTRPIEESEIPISKESSVREKSTPINLMFTNKQNIVTNRLFLSIGKYPLSRLSKTSLIFQNPNFLKLLANMHDVGAHKIYLYYDNVFWKNMTNSKLKTSHWLREMRYFDSPIVLPTTQSADASSNPTSGFLQVSYSFGDPHWEADTISINTGKSQILKILRSGNPRSELILSTLHKHVVDLHKDLVDLKNVETPKLGLYFGWHNDIMFRGGVVVQPLNFTSVKDVATSILDPVKGHNIHIINSDFTTNMGWEYGYDGSIALTEIILNKKLQSTRPSWIPEAIYRDLQSYDNIFRSDRPTEWTEREQELKPKERVPKEEKQFQDERGTEPKTKERIPKEEKFPEQEEPRTKPKERIPKEVKQELKPKERVPKEEKQFQDEFD